jgi:chaperone BCS1
MSDASFTQVTASSASDQPAFETRPFDAETLRTTHGINDSECAFVELSGGSRLYSLVVKHFSNAADGSFTPSVHSQKLSLIDDILSDENPNKSVSLAMGLGVASITHELNGVAHTVTAVHQRRGPIVGTSCGASTWNNLVLFVQGRENRTVLSSLLEELLNRQEETRVSEFSIWSFRVRDAYWDHMATKVARSLDSVVLPAATKTSLVADLDAFLSADTYLFYTSHGIPYKRSYLFHGVPGAGKTSLLQAIAGKYRRNLCVLQPTDPNFTDEKLQGAIQDAPNRSIIVLEDVDALFGADRAQHGGSKSSITFSGLLNALDGVANPEGQIFIMSTNHRERLDPALIRNGRVDLHVEFSFATSGQMEQLFAQFYPESDAAAAQRFREAVRAALGERQVNMAALQHYFIAMMRAGAEEAIAGVRKIVEDLEEKQIDRAAAAGGAGAGAEGAATEKEKKSGKATARSAGRPSGGAAGAIHIHLHTPAAAGKSGGESSGEEGEE